jgi:hypothetical protein
MSIQFWLKNWVWQKCSRPNPQHDDWSVHMSIPNFSLITTNETVGKRKNFVDNQLLGLSGSYLRHTIRTFNTCSRGSTHRSLIDTGGGYNLGGVGFPHHTLRSSQLTVLRFWPKGLTWCHVIQSQHKLKWKCYETLIVDPWSFDYSTSTEVYIYD